MAGKTRVIGFENLMELAPCQVGKDFAEAKVAAEAAVDPAKVAGEVEEAWKQLAEQINQEARRGLSPAQAARLRRDLGLRR